MAAWRRLVRLWRPMAAWTLLVWGAVVVVLGPLSSGLLARRFLLGEARVVGNEDLLGWALTPGGSLYILLGGGLMLVAAVVRYAGLFQIVSSDLEGRRVDLVRTAVELAPRVPALFRLCVAAVVACLLALLPLAAGLGGVYAWLLAEHDINYYLTAAPPAWRLALWLGGAWTALWLAGALFLLGRSLLALPLCLDLGALGGSHSLSGALGTSWERTRGSGVRLLRLVLVAAVGWALARMLAGGAFYLAGVTTLDWLAGWAPSLRVMAAGTFLYLAGSIALDAVMGFLGFSFLATLLTGYYHRDTDLQREALPPAGVREMRLRAARVARRWLRPARLLPAAGLVLLVSLGASGLLVETTPGPSSVVISAHRGGPPPAPENTLAAMERSIEAGAHYAEIDVQRTRDGVVVLLHDVDLMRVAGDPRRPSETSFEELAEVVKLPDDGSLPQERRLTTLGEFLERARGRIGLNIELKYYGWDPELAPAVVDEVRAREMEDEVVLMSLKLASVEQLRRLAPELTVGYVSTVAVGDVTGLPVDFLAVPAIRVSSRLLRDARERGVEIHAWTVNDPSQMADLMERGVDGIITDDPALAVRVQDEVAGLSATARLLLQVRRFVVDADLPAASTVEGREREAANGEPGPPVAGAHP